MLSVSASPVRQQPITSIYASSSSGAGGEIDRATLTTMFACLKILGFNKMKSICQTALSKNATSTDIENTISQLGLNPDVDTAWLLKLNKEGFTKIDNILDTLQDKKPLILDAFKKGGDRNGVIEIISLCDTFDWCSSRKLVAENGAIYLKEGVFSSGDDLQLFSHIDILLLFKEELTGLDLSKLNFSREDLSWANFDGSDLTGTILTGANQENMSICGTNLFGTVGFMLLTTTKLDNNTNFNSRIEILFDVKQLTGMNLIVILDLLNQLKPEKEFLLRTKSRMFELLRADGVLKKDDAGIICNFFAEKLSDYLQYDDFHSLSHKQMLSDTVAAANKFDLRLSSFALNWVMDYCNEFQWTAVGGVKDFGKFIDKNRFCVFQLLCAGDTLHPKMSAFFKAYTEQFFELCFMDQLLPDAITPTETRGVLEFEKLLPDLRKHFVGVDYLPVKDKLSFALTTKQNYLDYEASFKRKLKKDPEVLELMQMCSSVFKKRGHGTSAYFPQYSGDVVKLPKRDGLSETEIQKKYPAFRPDGDVPRDLGGLKFLVYEVEVLGPLTIWKIMNGQCTIKQAALDRLALKEHIGLRSWKKVDVLLKLQWDGSLSKVDIGAMTEQGKKNLKNKCIVKLIYFLKLPVRQALELDQNQVDRLSALNKHQLITNDQLTVKECLELTTNQFLLLARSNVLREMKKNGATVEKILPRLNGITLDKSMVRSLSGLNYKQVLFICALRHKYQLGGFSELIKVIKPQSKVIKSESKVIKPQSTALKAQEI